MCAFLREKLFTCLFVNTCELIIYKYEELKYFVNYAIKL